MNLRVLAVALPVLWLNACSSDSKSVQQQPDGTPNPTPTSNGNENTPPPAPTGGDVTPPPVQPTLLFAFVGSSDGKIHTYSVDPNTGVWTAMSEVAAGPNPWFMAFDPAHHRVVAIDDQTATVRSFTFDAKTGALTAVNSKPTGGDGPTHVAIDASGKWVTVANYGGGNVTLRPIDPSTGLLGDASDTKPSGAGSHWAGMDPLGHDLFVAAVERNAIAQYRVDMKKGKLVENGWGDPPPGAGPRHVVIHPSRKWCYAINEFANSVSAYYFDKNFAGKMWPLMNESALPENESSDGVTGAEIAMHPNGKFLYASLRGHNSIASFTIDDTNGKIARVANTPTEASQPRSFGIDPEGTLLFAGNQDANTVVGYRIDGAGALQPLGKAVDVQGPSFVGLARFAP